MLCIAKRQYLLTCKSSRYCLLALPVSTHVHTLVLMLPKKASDFCVFLKFRFAALKAPFTAWIINTLSWEEPSLPRQVHIGELCDVKIQCLPAWHWSSHCIETALGECLVFAGSRCRMKIGRPLLCLSRVCRYPVWLGRLTHLLRHRPSHTDRHFVSTASFGKTTLALPTKKLGCYEIETNISSAFNNKPFSAGVIFWSY